VLGDEFAHDHRKIGDRADDKAVAERLGRALRHSLSEQDLGKHGAERRTREGAGQHADLGDADLDRGEEAARFLCELERGTRSGTAVLSHRLQAGLAG
jgi:hypothetical protein